MTGCTDPAKNVTIEDFATMTVTQSAQGLGVTLTSQMGLNCTFTGALTQAGRFGSSSGTFNCNGKTTSGGLTGIAVGLDSLSAHFNDTNPGNGCSSSGYFSGARHG